MLLLVSLCMVTIDRFCAFDFYFLFSLYYSLFFPFFYFFIFAACHCQWLQEHDKVSPGNLGHRSCDGGGTMAAREETSIYLEMVTVLGNVLYNWLNSAVVNLVLLKYET